MLLKRFLLHGRTKVWPSRLHTVLDGSHLNRNIVINKKDSSKKLPGNELVSQFILSFMPQWSDYKHNCLEV